MNTWIPAIDEELAVWMVYVREHKPDMPHWRGRRRLAVLDALGWPLLGLILLQRVNVPMGIVGPMLQVCLAFAALARVWRAAFENHRYRFTTWRWGRLAAALWLLGALMKLAIR